MCTCFVLFCFGMILFHYDMDLGSKACTYLTTARPMMAQRKCSKKYLKTARSEKGAESAAQLALAENRRASTTPADPCKLLYSIAFLPEAAGTFFPTPHACRGASVPCVVCMSFLWPSICHVSWTEWRSPDVRRQGCGESL